MRALNVTPRDRSGTRLASSKCSGRRPAITPRRPPPGPESSRWRSSSGIRTWPIGSLHGVALDLAREEVHRRRADESGHEQVVRVRVQLGRRADLLELAGAHDRDPVAKRHRLGLVVRDVDRRRPKPLLDPGDLRPHLHAQLGVKVRERLVHQEHAGIADDRATHRDTLALPPGQVGGLAVEVLLEVEDLGRFAHLLVDLRLRRPWRA